MFRNMGAVLIGIVVGMAVNMALIQLNSTVFFPMPEGLDTTDTEAFNRYINTLPFYGFIPVIAAHLGQSWVGAWVAARLAKSHPLRLAMVIGVFSLAGGIMAMTMIDGPFWMVVELPFYLVVAWVAGTREEARRKDILASE
jgi:hypothetical protein